ncbi:MAG: FecR domain-containing protein [Bacteroidales bacterium]|jgi:ferric-dicitrate binding protein FerR (iron transport regulator)|nr:FecR domain-containing protein [Bacteroidales bacterium]
MKDIIEEKGKMGSKDAHDITEELLLRCLDKTASKEEYERVQQWVVLSAENRKYYRELLDTLIISNLLNPVSPDMQKQVWMQLDSKIRNVKKPGKTLFVTMLKYASVAAILVFIFITILFITNKPGTGNLLISETGKGEKRILELSDGSKVWLNEGTIFEYMDFSNETIREVTLVGEAYFEIAHDSEKPFVVRTEAMNVEVLGTQFNVRAYDQDILTAVTLVEGSVKVRKSDDNEEFLLNLGQQLRLDRKTRETNIYNVDCELYFAWKEGRVSFDQETFKKILFFMEYNYQLSIIIKDQVLAERKITGRFNLDENPQTMLRILQQSLNFEFYIQNDTIFINH